MVLIYCMLRQAMSCRQGITRFERGRSQRKKTVLLAVDTQLAETGSKPPVLERVVLPLDRAGKRDDKQGENTLVLRDRSLDYYKNVLRGKGASNLEIEAVHPLTHMGLDFVNPSGRQKILLVKAELVDQNTGLPVRGLYTPGSSGDNDGAGAMAANQVHMSAMASLTGEARQRINLPIYAEEDLLTEGRYLLRVVAEDAESQVWASEVPVLVVKKNMRALITLGLGILALVVYLGLLVRRAPVVLAILKTRRLITIALFGTCAFAVVSVPSTLLNDFFSYPFGAVWLFNYRNVQRCRSIYADWRTDHIDAGPGSPVPDGGDSLPFGIACFWTHVAGHVSRLWSKCVFAGTGACPDRDYFPPDCSCGTFPHFPCEKCWCWRLPVRWPIRRLPTSVCRELRFCIACIMPTGIFTWSWLLMVSFIRP